MLHIEIAIVLACAFKLRGLGVRKLFYRGEICHSEFPPESSPKF